ncbi:MAG: hypothetical protein JSU72_19130 [Deltaproteobacteria bacterium]|nr:MAG: hypothetical protein JSU72_19130 [Deltaproteobacteria bacterium]
MNEEELAIALSAHIDAVLTGQPMPTEDGPEELKQLLSLAGQLADIDLAPRPAFGQHLKRSLLDQGRGGHGGPGGSGGRPPLLMLGLMAVMGIIGLGIIAALLAVSSVFPERNEPNLLLTPTLPLLSPISTPVPTDAPVPPTLSPTAEAAATQVDTINPAPASATDRLVPKTTPSPALPLERVDQLTGGDTDEKPDRDSHGDSGHHCPHCDDDWR